MTSHRPQGAPPDVQALSVPKIAPNVAARDVGGELVVLDLDSRKIRGLTPTGGRVWALVDGARNVDQIARAIAIDCDEPAERVLADVVVFLTKLRSAGIIEIA